MSLSQILALLEKVPAPIVTIIGKIVSAIVSSDDPLRTAKRASIAVLSETGAEEAIKRGLSKTRKR